MTTLGIIFLEGWTRWKVALVIISASIASVSVSLYLKVDAMVTISLANHAVIEGLVLFEGVLLSCVE